MKQARHWSYCGVYLLGITLSWVASANLSMASANANEPLPHTVMSEGHPIRVWEKSPPNPRASIVLVHGRTWSTRPDFDLQVPGEDVSLMDGLVAAGIATYGVDMRGYGETPRDSSGWLTPNQAATDLSIVLTWVRQQNPELGKPHVFGWSYGSMISQLCVQQQPNLAQTLSLFGYPIRPGIDQPAAIPPTKPPAAPTTAAAARSDFITPGSISEAAISAFVKSALAADPVRTDWRQLEQWQTLNPARIAIPTLLIEAELDPLANDNVHARFFSGLRVNDKQWVMLPGGDHAAFMERSRSAFLAALTDFILRPRPANHSKDIP